MSSLSTSTTSRSRLSSKNTESEYDLCERSDTDTDTSHSHPQTHAHAADITGTTLQPEENVNASVDVSLDHPIAFDEKGVVVVENDPLSVVEDGVKRKVSLPTLPPLLRRNTTRPTRPSPPRRRLSLTSLLPSPRPLALFTRPSLPPPSSFSRNNGNSPNKLTRSLSSGSKGSKLVKHGHGQHSPHSQHGQANPAIQLPQTETQSESDEIRAQHTAQTSNPPLSPFGVKRSYTAPPPLGRWPPPPTITKSPCCKDCATSPTAHEGAAAEMGHVKVMNKGLEMKRQRRKRELEIALGLRERDGSGVIPREDVGSRDGQDQEQEREREQEQEQIQSADKSSEVIGARNGDGDSSDANSPKTPEGPITPNELARSPPPLRVANSVDTDLAPLLEGEEFVSTPVSARPPSGGVSCGTPTLVPNNTTRYQMVSGITKRSPSPGVTTPTSPARGVWICTPPARSPISPRISSFPVNTPVHDHAQRTNSNFFHTHNMKSHSNTSNDGNEGNSSPGPTLHRSESSSTFSSLTSSLRRNRPIVTRAMSTGRLATELDENGMVVCLSLHSERVLAPSSWRGGKGR